MGIDDYKIKRLSKRFRDVTSLIAELRMKVFALSVKLLSP